MNIIAGFAGLDQHVYYTKRPAIGGFVHINVSRFLTSPDFTTSDLSEPETSQQEDTLFMHLIAKQCVLAFVVCEAGKGYFAPVGSAFMEPRRRTEFSIQHGWNEALTSVCHVPETLAIENTAVSRLSN